MLCHEATLPALWANMCFVFPRVRDTCKSEHLAKLAVIPIGADNIEVLPC